MSDLDLPQNVVLSGKDLFGGWVRYHFQTVSGDSISVVLPGADDENPEVCAQISNFVRIWAQGL